MGVRNMKLNIYQKLHKAACEAGGVAKGKKVPGMHFNPLQHDEVQKVAMEALLGVCRPSTDKVKLRLENKKRKEQALLPNQYSIACWKLENIKEQPLLASRTRTSNAFLRCSPSTRSISSQARRTTRENTIFTC